MDRSFIYMYTSLYIAYNIGMQQRRDAFLVHFCACCVLWALPFLLKMGIVGLLSTYLSMTYQYRTNMHGMIRSYIPFIWESYITYIRTFSNVFINSDSNITYIYILACVFFPVGTLIKSIIYLFIKQLINERKLRYFIITSYFILLD